VLKPFWRSLDTTTPGLAFDLADRQQAEWCWTMLADHAWNGTDQKNKSENVRLRQTWNDGLSRLTGELDAWKAVGLEKDEGCLVLYNESSVPRRIRISWGIARRGDSFALGWRSSGAQSGSP